MSGTLLVSENYQASYDFTTYAVNLKLEQISRDGGTQRSAGGGSGCCFEQAQSRTAINRSVVEEYAEVFREGITFPPVTVYYDGEFYWLADGFHRVQAAAVAGIESIAADIRRGTRREAVLYSVGANACHGLRRTNVDKQRAMEKLLQDEEWGQWSDREIARRCGVSNDFVSRLRKSICHLMTDSNRMVQRNDKTYTLNTAKIGSRATIQDSESRNTTNLQAQEVQPLPPEPLEPQDLVREPKSKDKQLLPSIQPNPDVPPDEPLPTSASLVNTAAIANGNPDVVATEIAIGVRHLTPEQLSWVIVSAASNGLSDNHLKAVIKAAENALMQRRI